MKQTTSSLRVQPEGMGNNCDLLICESNKQYSTIVSFNRQSGGLSFLVLSKEIKRKPVR